jgi:hypothetical protein
MISCCAAAEMLDCDNSIVQKALNGKKDGNDGCVNNYHLEIVLIFSQVLPHNNIIISTELCCD